MGARLSLRPIPREEFLGFLNVQRLAHECWERLRVQPAAQLTSAFVDEALEAVVRTEYSGYARCSAGTGSARPRC
ncbi:MAG: hypothetical protein AAB409_03225 [Gemmatimonadota bacterium]